jgi:hypothetical protein
MDLDGPLRAQTAVKKEPTTASLRDIGVVAGAAGVVYAYERNLGAEGSVTVFLPRLRPR